MGSVERKHRYIIETGLFLVAHASAPLSLWEEAFQTAIYLINILPSTVTHQNTPYEILFKCSLDYNFLKVSVVSAGPTYDPTTL